MGDYYNVTYMIASFKKIKITKKTPAIIYRSKNALKTKYDCFCKSFFYMLARGSLVSGEIKPVHQQLIVIISFHNILFRTHLPPLLLFHSHI